jgi:hypothetical protein
MAVKRSPAWAGAMRKGLTGQNGAGWTVRDIRGRIQLSVRFEDGHRTSLVLDLPWADAASLPEGTLFEFEDLSDRGPQQG